MKFPLTSEAASPVRVRNFCRTPVRLLKRKKFFRQSLIIISDLEIVMHFVFVMNKLRFRIRWVIFCFRKSSDLSHKNKITWKLSSMRACCSAPEWVIITSLFVYDASLASYHERHFLLPANATPLNWLLTLKQLLRFTFRFFPIKIRKPPIYKCAVASRSYQLLSVAAIDSRCEMDFLEPFRCCLWLYIEKFYRFFFIKWQKLCTSESSQNHKNYTLLRLLGKLPFDVAEIA